MDFRQVAYYIAEPKTDKICAIDLIVNCTIFCDFIQLDKDLRTVLRGYNRKGAKASLITILSIDDIQGIRLLKRLESEVKDNG